jgi:hypothetical protein
MQVTSSLKRTVLALVVGAVIGVISQPVRAQSPVERLKRATEELKRKAEEAKKKVEEAARKQPPPKTTAPAPDAASAPAPGTPTAGLPVASASRSQANVPASSAKVEAQVLLALEPGLRYDISPKGQHLAAAVLRGSRQVVVHDGVDGPKFDEILTIQTGDLPKVVFSPDGNRFLYIARLGQEYVVMVDGKEMLRTPVATTSVAGSSAATGGAIPGFTSNSKHVYFVLLTQKGSRTGDSYNQLVFDGQIGPATWEGGTGIFAFVFSPDGEHYAYIARTPANPQQWALIVDGKPAAYRAGEPQFTADGLHLFTKNQLPGGQGVEVLLDGKPFMRAPGVELHMAPAGSLVLGVVADFGRDRPNWFLTVGNKKVPGSDCTSSSGGHIDQVYFSPDGKHFAARCQINPASFWLMVDGKKGPEYQGTSKVAFTADGRAVYVANMGTSVRKQFLIVGDQESDGYQQIVPATPKTQAEVSQINYALPLAVISGNRVGFTAMPSTPSGNNQVVVVDGKAAGSGSGASGLDFSPDGSRYAYLVGVPGRHVVVDGAQQTGMGFVGQVGAGLKPFVFSPDSKHIAYGASPESNIQKRGIALDGKFFATEASGGDNYNLTFTPDSKHLLWMGRSRRAPRYVIYVDGEPVVEVDLTGYLAGQPEIWWSMGNDGVLTFIAQDGGSMKRFRITPGNTSLETLAR